LIGSEGDAAFEGFDFLEEVTDFLKFAVDGGVADVGDGVEHVEAGHDVGAELLGSDLALLEGFEFLEDFLDGALHLVEGDRALLAGFDNAGEELPAVEGFAAAVAFDDSDFIALEDLVGGEAGLAGEAFAAAADAVAFLGKAGVDHFVIEISTLGAAHRYCGEVGVGGKIDTTSCEVNFILDAVAIRSRGARGAGR